MAWQALWDTGRPANWPVAKLLSRIADRGIMLSPGSDFAFPDTDVVKALLVILSTLRLVAGSKHAPRAFDSATWQARASSDRGIHKTNKYAPKVN